MTVQTPLNLQEKNYTARQDRQLLEALVGSPGVRPGGDLLVTSSGGARGVNVAAGFAFVLGSETAHQGMYGVLNDDVVLLTHDTAGTYPRLDMIVMRIYDSVEGDGADDAALEIVKGVETNGATLVNRSGAAVALPDNCLLIADALVPVGIGSAIPGANIADRRTFIAGPGAVPIGGMILYAGSGDLPDGTFVVPDGRLVDKTVYGTFFTRAGHKYNGGVDPGANKVRIPDKRGRFLSGAINLGTGAAANDNSHSQAAAGATGGEVNHTLTTGELASHGHDLHPWLTNSTPVNASPTPTAQGGNQWGLNSTQAELVATAYEFELKMGEAENAGSSTPHNNLPPYEADCLLVRIA